MNVLIFLLLSTCVIGSEWPMFGLDRQHSSTSPNAAECINSVAYTINLDESSSDDKVHFGSPLITEANTLILGIRTSIGGDFALRGYDAGTGAVLWEEPSDYQLPQHFWAPAYSPVLVGAPGPTQRVYYPGRNASLLYRDNLDAVLPLTFDRLTVHDDENIAINSALVANAAGKVFFTVRGNPSNPPVDFSDSLVRMDPSNGSVLRKTAAELVEGYTTFPHNVAMAFSNDESILYVVVMAGNSGSNVALVGVDPETLEVRTASNGSPMRIEPFDPRNGIGFPAVVVDQSSASPTVGPDGHVYYGVLGNPNRNAGWLLHFDAELQGQLVPGPSGWDITPSIVPVSAIPEYTGSATYFLFLKFNDYAGGPDGGAGQSTLIVVDPTDSEDDPRGSGALVMRTLRSILSPTQDSREVIQENYPDARTEWCPNIAAVDPSTGSIFSDNEDGNLYRWDLPSNTLAEALKISIGGREAYTPLVIGPDATVYAMTKGILSAAVCQPETATIAPLSTVGDTPAVTTADAVVTTTTRQSTECQTVTVDLQGVVFGPSLLTVRRGDTVSFVWTDSSMHNVFHTAIQGTCSMPTPQLFNSGNPVVGFGTTYNVSIGSEFVDGSYAFSCCVHIPTMTGSLTVMGECDGFEEATTEEVTTEEVTTEEVTTEEPTTEEPTTEEPTTEEPTTEEPTTEEPTTEEPTTEEPTTEEPTTEEPTTEEPTTEEPTTEEPTTEEPTTEEPTTEEPTTEEPTTEEPTTEEPTTQEPTTVEPTTEEPTTEEPTTEEPTTEEPTTEEPTTEEPTTQEPTTEEPTTEEPTTEEPTTDEPTTEESTTEEPTTDEPTTDEPTTEEPMTGDTTTEEPTTEEPTTDEPTTEESTTEEPTTEEPTTEEPTTEEPTTDEPTTEEPTTEEPTTEEPTTEEPTTEEPTTEEPTTEEPTTEEPTTTVEPTTLEPTVAPTTEERTTGEPQTTLPPTTVNTTAPQECDIPVVEYAHSLTLLDGTFVLEWLIDGSSFVGRITSATAGWVGLGFTAGASGDPLSQGDWILGIADVSDRWLVDADEAGPALDPSVGGVDNVEGIVCQISASEKQVYFRRALDTGDTVADFVLRSDGNTKFTAVASDSPVFDWTTPDAPRSTRATPNFVSEAFVVNLGSGFASNIETNLIIAHAVLMCVAFGVMFVAGVLVGRYVPRRLASWFLLHAAANMLGVALVLAGFVIAVVMVGNSFVPQFSLDTPSKGAHQILGVIALVWVFLQAMLGAMSKVLWNRKYRESASIPETSLLEKVHWVSGYCLPVLGFINAFLGIYDWGVDKRWMGLWGGYGGLVLVLFVILEIRHRKREKETSSDLSMYYQANTVPLEGKPYKSSKPTPPAEAPQAEPAPQVEPTTPVAAVKAPVASPSPVIPAPVMRGDLPSPSASDVSDEEEEATATQGVSFHAVASPDSPEPVEEPKPKKPSVPIPFLARLEASEDDDEEEEEDDADEIAKETDGELASTEEGGSASASALSTPGRSTPTESPRAPNTTQDNVLRDELAELEDIARDARAELEEMEQAMKQFE